MWFRHMYTQRFASAHTDVLCFSMDYMGGELIYLFVRGVFFLSTLQLLLTQLACSRLGNPAVWQCAARSDKAAMKYKNSRTSLRYHCSHRLHYSVYLYYQSPSHSL